MLISLSLHTYYARNWNQLMESLLHESFTETCPERTFEHKLQHVIGPSAFIFLISCSQRVKRGT